MPNLAPTRHRALRLPTALLPLALFFAACSQAPPPPPSPAPDHAEVTKSVTATAKVESVDAATRIVVLLDEKGRRVRVRAGDAVRNFAQIAAGDTVRVEYQRSLAVEVKKPEEVSTALSVEAAAGRAPVGATPAAAAGAQVTTTVRIESVDVANNIVVFTPPGGGFEAVEVRTPEGRDFIRGLRAGDFVQMTYTSAVALKVEKQ